MQKRLDVYLSENNTVKSRSLAASLIKQGSVEVNGRICTKASFAVDENDNIRIIGEMPKYVGRGGLKLEKALSHYRLHLDGSVCIDIGASTGGFTDCMLQNGAVKVYSVDVGTDQLDEKLRRSQSSFYGKDRYKKLRRFFTCGGFYRYRRFVYIAEARSSVGLCTA